MAVVAAEVVNSVVSMDGTLRMVIPGNPKPKPVYVWMVNSKTVIDGVDRIMQGRIMVNPQLWMPHTGKDKNYVRVMMGIG